MAGVFIPLVSCYWDDVGFNMIFWLYFGLSLFGSMMLLFMYPFTCCLI